MSWRAQRKLGLNVMTIPKFESEEESDTEYDADDFTNQKSNRFNLLLSDAENSDSNEEQNNCEENSSDNHEERVEVVKTKKKKKKKKTRKKQRQEKSESADVDDELGEGISGLSLSGDNIERIGTLPEADREVEKLLCLHVECKYLDPDFHHILMFGRRVVMQERYKVNPKKKKARNAREPRLAQLPDIFIPKDFGVTMELVKMEGKIKYYEYRHSKRYKGLQELFASAITAGVYTAYSILDLLHVEPLHIDGLIIVSEILHVAEERKQAMDALDKALYVLDHCAKRSFDYKKGDYRLDYKIQANRSFYIAVIKTIRNLMRLSFGLSAVAYSKVLLSLDPMGDPLAIVMGIDWFALVARDYKWFLQFYHAWGYDRRLYKLPNFLYSNAMAKFLLNKGPNEEATRDLIKALEEFPGVYRMLREKIKVTPPLGQEKFVFHNEYTDARLTPGLLCLCKLYVIQCGEFWEEPAALDWLQNTAMKVAQDFQKTDPTPRSVLEAGRNFRGMYRALPINIKRYLYLFGHEDLLLKAGVEAELTVPTIHTMNPFPDPEPNNVASNEVVPPTDQNSSIAHSLFESIFPSYTSPRQRRN